MALIDSEGQVASVGSLGFWLDGSDFVVIGEDHPEDVSEIGPHCFPRDWPDVYDESRSLRALLTARGPCAAKRMSVVPRPDEPLDGLEVRFLQSFANAERAKEMAQLKVVEGWAIYDLLDDVTGAAFLAERYWWNETEDGTWVDYSPRPENMEQMLLGEAMFPAGPKQASALTEEGEAIGKHLLALRFPRAKQAGRGLLRLSAPPAREPAEPTGPTEPTEPAEPVPEDAEIEKERSHEILLRKQDPLTAEQARGLIRRVREKEMEAVAEAAGHVAEAESCDRLITTGMSGAVVPLLQTGNIEAQRLLTELGKRSLEMPAPGAPLHKRMAEALMTADGLQPLVALLSKDMRRASLAAQALGHICFHNPPAQLRAARLGAIRALVRLIGRRSEGSVRDATYALWNILVGQKDHSATAFREGAAATLLPIIAPLTNGDNETLVNALGCVTSLLTAAGAQDALGANGAVEALCKLLDEDSSLALREQAASALANLLSGHNENCRKAAYKAAGLQRLIRLLQVSIEENQSRLAENCSAALANLVAATGPMLAQDTIDAGILDLAAGIFQVNPRPVQIFGLLANLCWQLPHLCHRVYQLTPTQRLVDVLKPGDQQPPRAALAALALAANLASVGPAKARLLKAGILKPTATFIESAVDIAVRVHASITLANLLENSPESVAKVFLELPDLPRRLAFLLNKKTPLPSSVREHVTRALALLASREASRVSVKESGAPEALWSLLDNSDLAKGASMGLLNLALVAKDRDKLLKKGLVSRLVPLLRHPEAGHFAAGALANLTAGSKTAARQAAEAGAVKPLVASLQNLSEEHDVTGSSLELHGSVDDAAAWVLAALAHLVELNDARIAQDAKAALPAMCRLLRWGEGSVQDLAIFALAAMAKGDQQELKTNLLSQGLELKLRDITVEGVLKEKAVMLHRLCLSK